MAAASAAFELPRPNAKEEEAAHGVKEQMKVAAVRKGPVKVLKGHCCQTKAEDGGLKGEETVDAVAGCLKGEETASAVAGCLEVKKGGMRLPDDEVKWILARKKEYFTPGTYTPEEIEMQKRLSDSFDEYQEWVREQYRANGGVVYLNQEQAECRANNRQLLQDIIDRTEHITFADMGLPTSDRYSDFYDSDEGEEEEGDESEEEEEEQEEEEVVVQELNAN